MTWRMQDPTSFYNVRCEVQIDQNADPEQWDITIDFYRPRVGQLRFTLPSKYVIKGWLPWRAPGTPLHFIPEEMVQAPLISSAFLIKKALDYGAIHSIPEALKPNRLTQGFSPEIPLWE